MAKPHQNLNRQWQPQKTAGPLARGACRLPVRIMAMVRSADSNGVFNPYPRIPHLDTVLPGQLLRSALRITSIPIRFAPGIFQGIPTDHDQPIENSKKRGANSEDSTFQQ